MEFEPRHAGHHHKANVKYGYIIFGISLVSALTLAVSNYAYLSKWLTRGAPNRRSIWARLGSPEPWWVQLILWSLVVIVLSLFKIHDFKEQYTTVIKRVGRLGFYLVPFDILLAIRPSLLATSYLEFIALHKWISRLILFMVSAHSIGYIGKWIAAGEAWKKSLKMLNFLGVVVFFLALVLVVISSKPIRRRVYGTFYLWHNLTVASFLVLIFWHARPGVTDAVILSVCMVAFQTFQRLRHSHWISGIVAIDEKSSHLRLLKLPVPENYPSQWYPGAHIRLTYPLTDARSWMFPSHPYTVFSLANDKSLELVVKKSHKFQVDPACDYTVSSPYASLPPPFFQTAEKVVVFCGGSGISLGIPIFRFLKSNASVHSELHWSVSNKSDSFVLSGIKSVHEVNVYVTKNRSTLIQDSEEYEQNDALLYDENEQYELESLSGDTAQSPETIVELGKQKSEEPIDRIKYHSGRPIYDSIFASLLDGENRLNNWIVVCGPKSMISSAKNWAQDHEVQVFSEFYEF
ncbi:hypothetical protein JCM33374_g3001 [Metschnikowia sp. JCM 33374]|nr:hypothetical protein JCM33374_g3001 [Metschnikowia sp. JCM 33374]